MLVGSSLYPRNRTKGVLGGTTVPYMYLYCRAQRAELNFVLHWILVLMESGGLFPHELVFPVHDNDCMYLVLSNILWKEMLIN